MAKQTVKQREKLKGNGVRRRKTPPPPSRPASKTSPTQEAAQERAIGFCDGVAATERFYKAMIDHKRGAREMIPNDIETPLMHCHRVREQAEREFAARLARPSLWQSIKGWFA